MLRQLAIQNVVLVERVELEFERGLGVLTGETGAGKSILLGALAVEIHGQHDDRGLLNPKGHRALLDAFGKLNSGAVASAWTEVTRVEAELAHARAEAAAAERDREFLEHASSEIAELAPEEG